MLFVRIVFGNKRTVEHCVNVCVICSQSVRHNGRYHFKYNFITETFCSNRLLAACVALEKFFQF